MPHRPRNDHSHLDSRHSFRGKTVRFCGVAEVEWKWKGGGVLGVSRSKTHGSILFWLTDSIDTSYINLNQTIKKKKKRNQSVWWGRLGVRAQRFPDKGFCFQSVDAGWSRFRWLHVRRVHGDTLWSEHETRTEQTSSSLPTLLTVTTDSLLFLWTRNSLHIVLTYQQMTEYTQRSAVTLWPPTGDLNNTDSL